MFRAEGDTIIVTMRARERVLIGQIPVLLAGVTGDGGDPGFEVLHRAVYRDDPRAAVEVANLSASEDEIRRTADRDVVERVASGATGMTRDEAHGFLRAVNEARLVLAARAGAFDLGPGWEEEIAADPSLAAVAWLGMVQSELIRTLSSPEGG